MQCRKLSFLRKQESSIYGVLVPLDLLDSRFCGNDRNGELFGQHLIRKGNLNFDLGQACLKNY